MKSMLKSLMSVAAAALALTSCSTDATDEAISKGELKTLVVNATIDQTRTTMADDHVKLNWSDGDEIHLYIGADATQDKVIDYTIGGQITGVTYNENDMVYAYYSTAVNNKPSEGVKEVLLNIPAKQEQKAASVFAGENLPMAASGTIQGGKVTLDFQPLGHVLVFNVYNDGSAKDEKVKSIKFETTVGCSGYDSNKCDLTAQPVKYIAYENAKSATVTLAEGAYATIGTAKPTDTKKGENQVYLVVAPVEYPAGSTFTVTTDAAENNTYTFTTTSALDCSKTTARVVNLNLARAAEMQPAIEVPTVGPQVSEGGNLEIKGINFKNIATDGLNFNEVVGVYSNPELNTPLTDSWITLNENAELFSNGTLNCVLAANTATVERTAYIGIKCAGVQAAIAITQVAFGSVIPDPVTAEVSKIVTSSSYKEYFNDDWTVTYGGGLTDGIASLGSSNTNNAKKCYLDNYPALAEAMGFTAPYNDSTEEKAAAIISKKALPAGYNTVTLEYNNVKAVTYITIAFSTDNGVTWTRIMDFQELSIASDPGSQTYKFPQQEAGWYAFVAKSKTTNSRITNCKITYSQE